MIESLGIGEAHIWYLWPDRVTNSARLASHERILADEERLQTRSFHFPEHRHSHLLTRAFVRILLSRYADVEPGDWQFARTHYGKPEVSGPPGAPVLNFGLSHTSGLIVCAFFSEGAIGVDAENLEHSVDCLEIAQKYFSPAEYRALQGSPALGRHRRFYEYWTLKESYVKARGLGLSLDLSRFAFHLEGRSIGITFDTAAADDPAAWQFRLFNPSAHHIVAASVRCGLETRVNFDVRDGTALMQ